MTTQNDDAVERWKESRAPRISTSGYMTKVERERDDAMLAIGIPQCEREVARQTFATTHAALRGAVRS